MKIVVNGCYGGFGLSEEAMQRYAKLSGLKCVVHVMKWGSRFTLLTSNLSLPDIITSEQWDDPKSAVVSGRELDRTDPILIRIVEELKDAANGEYAELRIVEIPDGTDWEIEEYDGKEWIAERHQTWY